jgi:hypothetical protein
MLSPMSREERQRQAVAILRRVATEANLQATSLEVIQAPDEAELGRHGTKADELADRVLDAVVVLRGSL